ncbi:MAG: AMP-binding protein [Acidobacteriota bacterium]|nr:AMP-binding protein [Acidobacteriota bacterium]
MTNTLETSGADDTSADAAEASKRKLLAVVVALVEELHPGRGVRRVGLDSSLDRDLALDSLGRVELVGRLEREFGVGLPERVVASADTPRDLLRALSQATATPGSSRAVQVSAGFLEAGSRAAMDEDEPAPERSRTLIEVLDWHVDRHPERLHITLLSADGEPEELTYGGLAERARLVAGGLQELGLDPGQAVGLMLPTELDYFAAFYGVLMAGGVPVPLYPPARPSQIEDHLRRQAGILTTARARYLIAMPAVLKLGRLLKAHAATLDRVVTVAELSASRPARSLPKVLETDTAFLQFTSGSTSDPKGVILTHANLLANLRSIGCAADLSSDDVVASWLPLYHDMGLIGAWMGSLYFAMRLVLMSPLAFLTRPSRWLWAVHNYRATISAAPNFGFELCLKKVEDSEIEGLDLSSWRASLNGAEPVSADTVYRFTEHFSACGYGSGTMMPVYGLAECSLALAFPPVGREVRIDAIDREVLGRSGRAVPAASADAAADTEGEALRFVGCGFPLPDHEIRIVDSTGAEVGERQEGSIEFRGPGATSGYFRNPAATKKLFHGNWLDSGDLGYIAEGELFVTGRAKDLIIRAGRNIYPQELEEAVGAVEGVRKGCVAVFGSTDPESGTERLVVLVETRLAAKGERDHLRDRIQELAVELVGTPADDVALVEPQTVPKTSSGKLRRAASRELYESGKHRRRGPAWWQVARLAVSGARPQLARTGRAARELAYAGRFWAVVGLAAVPVTAALVVVPRLARRRRVAREAAKRVAQLTSTPIQISGAEYLSSAGPWVMVANHSSYLDGFALTATLPTQGAFLAKSELQNSFLAKLLLDRLGTLFVERFDPNKGVEDIRRAADTLRSGQSLLLFPEGTFDRAPGLRPFRLGAFALAAETGVPVVPVAIRGTRSVLRGDKWFPRKGAVKVTVGEPIEADGKDLAAAARLRDAVRDVILRHCGEPDLQSS